MKAPGWDVRARMEDVSMPTYIVIESGSDRVLGVTAATDPVSACIEVSRRLGNPTSRVLYEIRANPRYGDWLAYELPGQFDDPIAWEMFGLDAVRHGRLVTVIARRPAR
jgi:hypothetical protein